LGIHNRHVFGVRFWAEGGLRFVGAGREQSLVLGKARETKGSLRKALQARKEVPVAVD
jgi:hypothetical protein